MVKSTVKRTLNYLFPKTMSYYDVKRKHKRRVESLKKYDLIPEEEYPSLLKQEFLARMGCELHLENPTTFSEKIQWRKLYDRNPLYTQLSDKYLVKKWVADRIGSKYVIKNIGVWEKSDDIDFENLPERFVLKTNNGCGTTVAVKNKSDLDIKSIKEQLNYWLNLPFCYIKGFELQYRDIKPKIIAEEYIEDENGNLFDYKIECFHGEPLFILVTGCRNLENGTGYTAHYDLEWNRLDWIVETYEPFPYVIPKPMHFDEMLYIARILSADFDYVRVDLYDLEKGVLFGEMTFTQSSGMSKYQRTWTYEKDVEIGKYWNISK